MWVVLILVCMTWDEKASMVWVSFAGKYFIIFTVGWLTCNNLTILYCSCSPSNCKKISHSGIYPGITKACISFFLIMFTTLLIVGVPKIMGTCAAKFEVWQIWDCQSYLILIIALDSIHLNPYDNVAYQLGKCITQTHTGNPSAY